MKKIRLCSRVLGGLLLIAFFLSLSELKAQDNFSLITNVPDSVFVDSNCNAVLDWGHPTSVQTTCNTPGCTVIYFDIFSISAGYEIGDLIPAGQSVLITYYVEDDLGNDAYLGFDIEFVDGVPPVWDGSTLPPATATYDCLNDVPSINPVATENCPPGGGGVTVNFDGATSFPSDCSGGTFTRSWTAIDWAGNSIQYVQTVTINPDPTPPTVDASFGNGLTTTAQCGSITDNLTAYQNWFNDQLTAFTAAASDPGGCSGTGGLVITPDTAPSFDTQCGTKTVEFSAFDACGNFTTRTANFEIVDNSNPITITDADNQNIILQCDILGNSPIDQITNYANNFTVIDNCGPITWSSNYSGLNNNICGGTTGEATVIYTVVDGCGNSDNIAVNFTVFDGNPPNITMGAEDITVECNGNGNLAELNNWIANRAGAIAEDICTPLGSITEGLIVSSDPSTNDPATALANAIAAGCVGGIPPVLASITVEFTYTDLCDNTSTTNADFVITDSSIPQFTSSPDNITVACETDFNAALTNWYNTAGNAAGGDACSSVSFRGQPDLGSTFTNLANSQAANCGNTGTVSVDFYVQDACGNENPTPITGTFTITDNAPPVITNPAVFTTVECDGSGNLTELNNWLNSNGGAAANDLCGGNLTWTNDFISLSNGCGSTGSGSVVFSVTDECGNIEETTAVFAIQDTTDPVWTSAPTSLSINCDTGNDVTAQINNWLANNGGGSATDDCGIVSYSNNYAGLSDGCGASGTTSVTFSAFDECGRSISSTVTLQVTDNTAPVISTQATDLNVVCDGSGNTTDITAWLSNNGGAVATDGCSGVTWTNNYASITGTCGASGSTSVTFTATDACGFSSTTVANITIIDTEIPTIWNQAQDITVDCENPATSLAQFIDNRGGANASDNCSTIDNSPTSAPNSSWSATSLGYVPGCGNSGTETYLFTVTDACGNTATTTASYSTIDDVSPEINPTSTSVFETCGEGNDQQNLEAWINNVANAMTQDGCGNATWSGYTWTTSDGDSGSGTFFAGPYPTVGANSGCLGGSSWEAEVTFTSVDECNNTSTTTSSFRLIDNVPPTINGIPADLTINCGALPPETVTASDNCDPLVDVTLVADTFAMTCPNRFVITRTWTASDDCDNVAVGTQTITVQDNEDPYFLSGPADITVDCVAPVPVDPIPEDNCTADVLVTMNEAVTNQQCANGFIMIRTWTAFDACGNSGATSQLITVIDTNDPVLSGVPASVTVECSNVPLAPPVTATDGCDNDVDIQFIENSSQSNDPNSCGYYSYTRTRTWIATDNCGNEDLQTQLVTVQDTQAPAFAIPFDVTIQCDQVNDITVTGNVFGIFDNCDIDPDVNFNDVITNSGCANNFLIARTWSVTDACGNANFQTQLITVEDDSGPSLTTPATNQSITCTNLASAESDFAAWVANNGGAIATDNCGTTTWVAAVPGSYDINDPSTWPGIAPGGLDASACPSAIPGAFRSETVDFIAFDDCNNAVVTSATFTVTDNIAPVFTFCPPSVGVDNDPGQCGATVTFPAPVITEDCDNSQGYVGPTTITQPIFSTDPGNVEVPVETVMLSFTGLPSPPVNAVDPVTLVIDLINFDGEEPTEYFFIFGEDGSSLGVNVGTAVQCGNSSTSVTITAAQLNAWAADGIVNFSLVPNVPTGLPGRFAVNDICGNSSVNASLEYGTSTANNLAFAYSINDGPRIGGPITTNSAYLEVGSNMVYYYATDCAGNESVCSFEVYVNDTEEPSITCPSGYNINTTGCFPQSAVLERPTGMTDNCGFADDYVMTSQTQNISFDEHPNLDAFVANDVNITFSGTMPPPVGDATVTVWLQADIDNPLNEFFTINAEGTNIGNTGGYTGSGTTCSSFSPTTFTIPVAQLQAMAADGTINIVAESNTTAGITASADQDWNNDDQGINPCVFGSTPYNGTESTVFDVNSNIYVEISYPAATVSYAVSGPTTIPNTSFPNDGSDPTVTLNPGNNSITYSVMDQNGNTATCSYNINVGSATLSQPVVTVGQVPGCPGELVTLTDVSGFMGTNPSWVWYDENDNVIATTGVPSLTFPAAIGAVSYYVIITDQNCFSEASNPVEVDAGLGATAPIITANPSPACEGDDVVLFLTNNQIDYVDYQWTGPNGYSSNQQFPPAITNISTLNEGPYNLLVTNALGCTGSGTVYISVNQAPPAPSLATNSPVCFGEDIVLSTSSVCNTYIWIGPDGDSPATLANPLLVTSTNSTTIPPGNSAYDPGIWTLICQDANGCQSEESEPKEVIINAPLASAPTNNGPVCEGDEIQLQGTAAAGATYEWTGPNGFTSNQLNPSIFNADLTNAGGYSLLITDVYGCTGSGTTIVSVLNSPEVTSIESSLEGCVNGSDDLTLTATISPADDGSYTYLWTGPNGFTSFSSTPVIPNASEANNGSYTLVVTNGTNCSSNPMTVVVSLDDAPEPPIITTTNQACEGDDIVLNTTSIPGASYSWSGPLAFTSDMQNPIITNAVLLNSGTYTVTVTDDNGCVTEASTTIVVNTAPVVTAVSNDGETCATGADDITLSASVFPVDTGSDYIYTWTGPNGFESFSANPVLPNANSQANGSYTVFVTNEAGCTSNSMTTVVNVSDAPLTPILSADAFLCEGETLTLETSAYSGSSVIYTWTTPLGTETTTVPTLTFFNAGQDYSGEYTVTVAVDGCASGTSSPVEINVSALPVSPAISSNSPVCSGGTIELMTDAIPGATYIWSGPNGFTASVQNPTIFNADADDQGAYTVQITLSGCVSQMSAQEIVLVGATPTPPVLANNGPICVDDGNASLTLSVTPASAIPGATYTWYDVNNNVIAGPTPALDVTITDFTNFVDGVNNFYVVADVDGCASVNSVPTTVMLNTAPAIAANAGPDVPVCIGDPVNLSATLPSVGSGMWVQTGGPIAIINNPNSPNTAINGVTAGSTYTFTWFLSNGACVNYASDDVQVFVSDPGQIADAGTEVTACDANSAILGATPPNAGTIGTWSQTTSQAALGVVIADPNDPNTSITGLVPGSSYEFTWTLSSPGCGDFAEDQVVVVVLDAEANMANAGDPVSTCGDIEAELNANQPAPGFTGTWSSPDLDIDIFNPNQFSTIVTDLEPGENILLWSLSTPECGTFSVDTVIVTLETAPTANDDNYTVAFNDSAEFNVAENDEIGGTYFVTPVTSPANGTLDTNENGIITYTADIGFVGVDVFTYQICLSDCPDECAEATVTLNVGEDAGCIVPTIFTPNNDGVNDEFIVPCLATDRYPENEVAIFNQWGDEVYRSSPYANDWIGKYNGEDLPVGTYFYVINFGNGEAAQSGFLILER